MFGFTALSVVATIMPCLREMYPIQWQWAKRPPTLYELCAPLPTDASNRQRLLKQCCFNRLANAISLILGGCHGNLLVKPALWDGV